MIEAFGSVIWNFRFGWWGGLEWGVGLALGVDWECLGRRVSEGQPSPKSELHTCRCGARIRRSMAREQPAERVSAACDPCDA